MSNLNKVIIESSNNKTSEEKNLELIKKMEIQFNTGPIIGEARELLYYMAQNLMIRDLLLSVIGVSDEQKEKMFIETTNIIDKRDAEILKERSMKC